MPQDLKVLLQRRGTVQNAFRSAQTLDEMLRLLPDLEELFAESELGLPLLRLSIKHHEAGHDFEKTLQLSQRALGILVNDTGSDEGVLAAPIANATQLCGLTCLMLEKYDDCLYYLNTACRLLNKLRRDGAYVGSEDIMGILYQAELGLYLVKKTLEKREEAIIHLRNAVELRETVLKHGSDEVYLGYKQISGEYLGLKNHEEALYFGLKALEKILKYQEPNVSEVVDYKRYLGRILRKLNEGEIESEDSIMVKVQDALRQIEFGSCDEAVDTLTATVQDKVEESKDRAILMVSVSKTLASMGKTLWKQKKIDEAKRCLDCSLIFLDRQESCGSSDLVVATLIEASQVYEKLNEIEAAIMVSRRLLKVLEKLPQEQSLVGKVTGIIGRLLLSDDQLEEAVPYLEDAVEKLKASYGSRSYELASTYNDLGSAYLALERPNPAAQVVEYAKEIMDGSLGPGHVVSLRVYQNLSRAYAAMGRYHQAIKLLEQVVEGFKRYGPSVQDDLDAAIEYLEEVKEEARNES